MLKNNQSFYCKKAEKMGNFRNKTVGKTKNKKLESNLKKSFWKMFRKKHNHRKIKTGKGLEKLKRTTQKYEMTRQKRRTEMMKKKRNSSKTHSNEKIISKMGQNEQSEKWAGEFPNNGNLRKMFENESIHLGKK